MHKSILLATACVLCFTALVARGQINDFGDRAVELRGLASDEFARPEIPDDAVTNAPPGAVTNGVARPLSLVYRYYSCIPWLALHVRSAFSSMPGYVVEVDTANDNPEQQLVNETNEARLGMQPGTALNHAAYGLYCLKVSITVRWTQWAAGTFHRFYVRLHHRHPYVCWQEQWWYYWSAPRYNFQVRLNGAQQVPANASPALGNGVLAMDPIYKWLCYEIGYSGLGSAYSQAHIHGPAGAGTNAGVIFPLNNVPTNAMSGQLYGVTPPLSPTQEGHLRNGLLYVNIHSVLSSGGEIRSQILQATQAVYSAWRPAWTPMARWGRGGPLWCLTVTHPYGYPWDDWYRPRPVCLYGLRYYFTPIGNIRTPATLPFVGGLTANHAATWIRHQKPPLKYWPYSPYCARWYWWWGSPFSTYRHLPPVVQYATWVNPDISDLPVTTAFPDDPMPSLPGTVAITTLRALVSQQGDLTGDGFVNLSDLSNFRQEQGTVSQDTQDRD